MCKCVPTIRVIRVSAEVTWGELSRAGGLGPLWEAPRADQEVKIHSGLGILTSWSRKSVCSGMALPLEHFANAG